VHVNAVWIGAELPLLHRVCINSWAAHGHSVDLWTYADIGMETVNATNRDARDVLDGELYTYQDKNHRGSFVLHANLFRYQFLATRGGAFIDADTLCLAPFDAPRRLTISSEGRGQGAPHPNFAFVNVPDEARIIFADCMVTARSRLDTPYSGLFGPKLLKEHLVAYSGSVTICEPHRFCPLNWNAASRIFQSNAPSLAGSLGVHLWQRILAKRGEDCTKKWPATSLWEKWKNAYA